MKQHLEGALPEALRLMSPIPGLCKHCRSDQVRKSLAHMRNSSVARQSESATVVDANDALTSLSLLAILLTSYPQLDVLKDSMTSLLALATLYVLSASVTLSFNGSPARGIQAGNGVALRKRAVVSDQAQYSVLVWWNVEA